MADTIRYGTEAGQESKDRYFKSQSELPLAATYGPGIAQVGGDLYVSDGANWTAANGFTPSIYSATYSATTAITSQSEALATGTKKLSVTNKATTDGQSAIIGFGATAAEARTNATNQVAGKSYLILPDSFGILVVAEAKYFAWVGTTATVSLRITQGV